MSHLGKLLKKKRLNKKLSQGDVAKEMGWISGQFVSNYERGTCLVPINRKLFTHLGVNTKDAIKLYLKDEKENFIKKVGD
jgi:transcriptional regulator with XRE-family HTH domain